VAKTKETYQLPMTPMTNACYLRACDLEESENRVLMERVCAEYLIETYKKGRIIWRGGSLHSADFLTEKGFMGLGPDDVGEALWTVSRV
jgi:hypothetical protein